MSLRSLSLIFAVALLSACGTQSKVVTTDDSADYQSARSIPPLKKVNVNRNSTQQAPISQPVEVGVAQAEAQPTPAELVTPQAASPVASEKQEVAFRVVELDSGQVRMQLQANPNDAWSAIDNLLIASDVTVHSKNQVAGYFSIACEGIEQEPAVVKKGGWSFFNRKTEEQVYCAIKLIDVKGSTFASVFNRRGAEASGAEANGIFNRLLNPNPESY